MRTAGIDIGSRSILVLAGKGVTQAETIVPEIPRTVTLYGSERLAAEKLVATSENFAKV